MKAHQTRGDSSPGPSHLWRRSSGGRVSLFTEALGTPPSVRGEGITNRGSRVFRRWEPSRSKLAAALVLGYPGRIPESGERWLYLGAAQGGTASYIADLLGPAGRLYALERSVRAFARLIRVAEQYPNLLPILADARNPGSYVSLVPPVDGLYVDVAQPDQLEIAETNARWMLRDRGALLMALKTSSMGRDTGPSGHRSRALERLRRRWEVDQPLNLAPHHRGHFWLSARPRRALFSETGGARVS